MLIARELRKTNIAEYILYMWQIEDLLRACSFNAETIEIQLVSRFDVDENTRKTIAAWYNSLAAAMEKERIQERGHLQALVNLVNDLNEFHLKMLEVCNDQEYVNLYIQNRPAIAELTRKTEAKNDVALCLNALYGLMFLKLKQSDISAETQQSVGNFARLIGHLSARYLQFENDDFEF